MTDLNQCTFTGRLGADPEIRRTQGGKPIANLRLAVSDTWKDKDSGERKEKTEWVSVVVFNEGLCKVIENYLKKGSRVLVQGSQQTRKWKDQSGNDRYSTECVLQAFNGKLVMLDNRQSAPAEREVASGDDLDSDSIPF
jgi:single-strand DNA-binding protein